MSERHRILIGMIGALLATLSLVALGPWLQLLPPQAPDLAGRAYEWGIAALMVLGCLTFAVARLARQRFSSDDDLDPMRTEPTSRAVSLDRQLQNTLEQTVLAISAYAVWAVLTPSNWGTLPIFAALLFSLGRLQFFWGYSRGAASRSLGFALTFYPTIAILICSLFALLVR